MTAGYLLVLYFILEGAQLTLRTSVVTTAVLALIMALAFIPLREFAQERVDRLFYRHTYDYRRLLLDFSRKATDILSVEELSREMIHLLINTLRSRWGALLFPDPVSAHLRAEYVEHLWAEEGPQEVSLRQDNPLIAHLVQNGQVLREEMIDVIPQGKGLWEAEREELRNLEVGLLCPVLARGTLSGLVVLGAKDGGRPYTDEETDLLLTMASGAAVAIENARMLRSLRQREQAHDLLLSRVVSAQEEERQRIASDLHDSVAQWLIRASYQTQVVSALNSGSQNDGLSEELKDIE